MRNRYVVITTKILLSATFMLRLGFAATGYIENLVAAYVEVHEISTFAENHHLFDTLQRYTICDRLQRYNYDLKLSSLC